MTKIYENRIRCADGSEELLCSVGTDESVIMSDGKTLKAKLTESDFEKNQIKSSLENLTSSIKGIEIVNTPPTESEAKEGILYLVKEGAK